MTLYSLKGETVLITGAGGRIGSEVARQCLENGAKVIACDISREKLETIWNKSSKKESSDILLLNIDITGEEGMALLFQKIDNAGLNITSAVHSAYPTSAEWGTKIECLREEMLKTDLQNQLGTAILISQKIIKRFQENKLGGNLIHLGSIQGVSTPKFEHYVELGMHSPIEYTGIKAGIIGITRWLAKYYANQGIRVNCISPGGIRDKQPEEFIRRYRKSCCNIGMLSARDISEVAIFLLSKESRGINGQNLIVDDGWSL
ncbi:MAG: short-chain dehydrogenase [Pelagibacteraceae bacterium TMED65]|nr:MAG: short-chain dehydrogenase [Pelagibacteraceae bacterium TMED65]